MLYLQNKIQPQILGPKSEISHFWPGNREKWLESKNFFGLCLFMLNDTRKSIVQMILMIGPKKVVFTPTPNENTPKMQKYDNLNY